MVVVKVVKGKSALAYRCDSCKRIFDYGPGHTRGRNGLTIRFDKERSGHGGNFDTWEVCSVVCADAIVNGGWLDTKQAAGFRKAKAKPKRVDIKITLPIKTEEELIAETENGDRNYWVSRIRPLAGLYERTIHGGAECPTCFSIHPSGPEQLQRNIPQVRL